MVHAGGLHHFHAQVTLRHVRHGAHRRVQEAPPPRAGEVSSHVRGADLSEDRPATTDRAAKVSAAIDRILTDNAQVFEKLAQ